MLEALAGDRPLPEVLAALALDLERSSDTGMLASILLLDRDGLHLRHGAAPSLPAAYNETLDGLEIGPAAGSCGTALYTGERVVVSDIASDPLWVDYRDLAAEHGLAACWSTPIRSGSEILGTFAVYYREPRSPEPDDLLLVDVLTRTAALAIERERSTAAERKARAQLEQIFVESPALMGVLRGPDHVLERANPAFLRAVGGRTRLGEPIRESLPTIDDAYFRMLDSVFETGEPVRLDEAHLVLERGDGTLDEHWFNYVYQPLREPDGSVAGVYVNAVDVTEQVQARLRIEAAEERLRLAADAGGVGTWVWDVAADRLFADERLAFLVGLPRAEAAAGMPLRAYVERVHEDDRPRVEAAIAKALAGTEEYELEFRVRGAGGEPRWVLVRGRVDRDAEGRPVRCAGAVSDVSEKNETARLLAVAHRQIDASLKAGRIGIWTWDPVRDRLVADELLARFFGLDPAEAASGVALERVVAAIDEADRPAVEAAIGGALASGDDYVADFRVRDAAGTVRWILGRGSVEQDADGNAVALVGMGMDVTAERRANERLAYLVRAGETLGGSLDLHETLGRLTELALPELADFCVFDVLEEGEVVQVAAAHRAPEHAGFAARIARHVAPLDHPAHPASRAMATRAPQLRTQIDDAWLGTISVDDEHRALLESLGISSLLSVPLLVGGDAIGAATFGYAGSGRRHGSEEVALAQELAARAALALENARLYREAEQRAHATAAFTFVGDGVALVDDGGAVRTWNPAAERISGVSAAAALGRPLEEVLAGWHEVAERIPVSPADAPGPAPRTILPVRVGEQELWLTLSGTSFDGGTVYTFADATAERGLDRLRSELIATVSHELRTPLAAVYGAAATLRRRDAEIEGASRDELLEMIETQANRLAATVEEILLASRLEAGKVGLALEPVDAAEVAREVAASVRAASPAAEIAVVAPADGARGLLDPQKLGQVLRNLLENAVRYSNGAPVELRVETDDRVLRFAVSDEGIGIAPAEQELIFGRFYRVDSNASGGTGLGLYICGELARQMGGRIWVESELGRGSTFRFELPRAPL